MFSDASLSPAALIPCLLMQRGFLEFRVPNGIWESFDLSEKGMRETGSPVLRFSKG